MNTTRHTDSPYGGDPGRALRLARHQARCSGHRREVWRARRRAHLRRLRLLSVALVPALVLLGYEITRDTPSPALVGLGLLGAVAWLTEALNA